ncbi:MAG: hypothetical protein ACI3YT_09745, partial [Prevotella sp.]
EAFYAKQGITVTDGGTVNVTLSRAVAKVTLNETDRLVAGSIKVTYDGFKDFNVSEGKGVTSATLTQTLPIATTITGTVASPTEVGSFLLLANADEPVLSDFKVQYNSEAEKTITNVPVQANYVTNINGKFSVNANQQFSISINDTWATPSKIVDPNCLTFSAASLQTFSMYFEQGGFPFSLGTGEYFEYSVGGGDWTKFTSTIENISFGGTLGDLRLRGKSSQGTAVRNDAYSNISFGISGVMVDCKGDIRTLIDYENHETVSTANARFCDLFYWNTLLKTAPALPATTLANYCYYEMFSRCTSLIAAPVLPATTLADHCYEGMFEHCTFSTAPELLSPTLAEYCYARMFAGCTSLTTAPALPAKTLAICCYDSMFKNCTSLTTAPELLAQTLANKCYGAMFDGCTSLTAAPELPAKTLAPNCYGAMFRGCTKLSEVTMKATDVSANDCLDIWILNSGTEASSRTLTLANQDIYNTLAGKSRYLPDNWKSGMATIQYTNP